MYKYLPFDVIVKHMYVCNYIHVISHLLFSTDCHYVVKSKNFLSLNVNVF